MKNVSFLKNKYWKVIVPVLVILLLSILMYHVGYYVSYNATISGIQ